MRADLHDCRSIALIVGSEGGFDPEEAEQLQQNGAVAVWLGHRILRCETAPLAAISIVMHRTGKPFEKSIYHNIAYKKSA